MDYQTKQENQRMLNNTLRDVPDKQYIDRKFSEINRDIDDLARQLRSIEQEISQLRNR